MADDQAPYHAHIYYLAQQRLAAEGLRDRFIRQADVPKEPPILFVGRMVDTGVGPHPMAQYKSTSSSVRSRPSFRRLGRPACVHSSIH